jgi:integrase
VQGFHDYLDKEARAWTNDFRKKIKDRPLSKSSKASYFCKLRACLNQAFEERIIPFNPVRGIENFKPDESRRMYLTIDEVRKLVETECEYPGIKRAFLFSCLTGLRRSDILNLTWGDIYQQGKFTRIIFRQRKTGGQEYIDISEEAASLLGERGEPKEHPFTDIFSPDCTNKYIRLWCMRAGIDKDISFHCGRHTFATMMLDIGTDLYTVSKLLGHKEIGTTQIYAKVMDKNKQAAVQRIPSILGGVKEEDK